MSPVLHALVRSGLVLTGLLLLAVGIGNVIAGQSKLEQYGELAALTQARAPRPPATLFPATTEGEERHALARAKVAFYQLLVTAGRLLTALGIAFFAIGALRVWMRAPRPPSRSPVAN
jgi:hypothetical protein